MHRIGPTLVAASLMFGLAACGSDKPAASPTPTKANTFVLDEWSIVPPKGDLTAGKVAVTATNEGTETHELVIVRASDAASLPKKDDGSVDEDKIPESKKAGEIADIAAGKTQTMSLAAGDYIALCNIVEGMSDGMGSDGMNGGSGMGNGSGMGQGGGMDHVHFELGMVNYFTVT